MTQDEIIVLWGVAGGNEIKGMPYSIVETFAKLIATNTHPDGVDAEWVARRTKYAVEQEREACAKVCDDLYRAWTLTDEDDLNPPDAIDCKRAIRARGEA